MGRDGQPFRLQMDQALVLDVQCRIDVPVVLCVTGGATIETLKAYVQGQKTPE
ncbi:hypothetical protein TK90_2698 (plasmid) [Thioalkalivibrio sp. K90mix]|nr:hypothetical protein TK90_2698 [Thioalkalivibrio sp. K90mix]